MAEYSAENYGALNLPFSPEAEQSVLGAVLLDSSCLDRVAELLPRPDYFYQSNNSAIYAVMLDLFTMGQPVDFVTVLEKLKEQEGFEESGVKTYLLQLAQLVPSITNVETYARIVRDRYDVRTLIVTAREIVEEASEGGADASTLLDSAEQRIFDIRRGKNMQGLQRLNEIIVQTFDRLDLLNSPDSDAYRGIPTGIHELDETITGLNKTDFILLGARPGMGKTSFALNIARHAAVKAGKTVAFFSLEMGKEQLCSRLLSTEALVGGTKLRTGKLENDEWVRLIEAGDILSHANIYLDDTPSITVPEIKAKLRRLKHVDLVIIDYLQLMTSANRRSEGNRVQEISEITRSLLARDSEKRTNHRPVLSDLRDSGSIEQDADIVLFLYREDYYAGENDPGQETDRNSGECIVAKNRHGEAKTVPLHWQGEFMRFTAQEVVHHAP